ncbi:Autotransporter domain-containing protein [Bordetella sputigena]|uniref:autotransporter outer membrane beta-barrel domain-containing protein n=1 Tax=Bordetella sputigena TaxID=1416810 RepID=UPI0039EE8CB6
MVGLHVHKAVYGPERKRSVPNAVPSGRKTRRPKTIIGVGEPARARSAWKGGGALGGALGGAIGGAAALGLLMNPFCDARAQEYAAEYGWSDRGIEVTDGDRDRRTRVLGPVRTHGDTEHGVKALRHGSSDLTGPTIHTFGSDAYGVYYSGAARLFITGARITTRGERSHGVGSVDERGDDLPDWAYANTGELRMAGSTINLEGNNAHGVHAVGDTGIIHLGPAFDAGSGAQGHDGGPAPAHQSDRDVWIFGKGERNTAIHVVANRRVTFNGVRAILYGPASTGILVRENATLDGRNLWLYGGNADSVGLRAVGRIPCAIDARRSRCPEADTTLRITHGFVHMQAPRSPAVEVQRARVHLRDVYLTTGPDTPYAVGNEAGRFRFSGDETRAVLKSRGAALRAWVRAPEESAAFYLRKADIRSGNDTLLELVRPDGAATPRPRAVPRKHYVMLQLDDTQAHGAVRGIPDSRAHIHLAHGSVWRGNTDIGGKVYIDSRSTWVMDANSTVDRLTMSPGGTLRFARPEAGGERAPRFHGLTIQERLRGKGRFEMHTHLTRGAADRVDILGGARGSYAVLITDHSGDDDTLGPRAVPIVQARRGNASFVLENDGQAVDVQGHRYTLVKRRTASGVVWSLEREPDDAPVDDTAPRGSPGTPATGGPQGDDGGKGGAPGGGQGPDGQRTTDGGNTPAAGGSDASDGGDDGVDAPIARDDDGFDEDGDRDGDNSPGPEAGEPAADRGAIALGAFEDDTVEPPPSIRTSLVNNSGIASASALWMAALRAVEDRGQALRAGGDGGIDGPDAMFAPIGDGIWIRGIDKRQHPRSSAGGYRQSLWGYTLGADRTVKVAAGRWRLGGSVSEVDAHRDFDDGKGRASTVLFGAYAVLQLDNGAYASVAASAGRFRNTVQASGPDIGGTVIGKYRQSGGGLSVGGGQRLNLSQGWFIEPGAGLSYFKLGGARYTLSDGTAVHDRGGHTLQSRASVRAGRGIDLGNGNTAAPYVRFSWLREFGNRGRIRADDAALRTDMSGNRYEIGAGVEARLGKRHFLYADVEVAKGAHLTRSRAVVAGYQYRW